MDEKKLYETIKRLFDGMTDEQKKVANACKDTDELMKLMGEWGIELPDELVEQVAGGYQLIPWVPGGK